MSLLKIGLLLLLLLVKLLMVQSYPNCQLLTDEDGKRTESLALKAIGLFFPESFEISLNPGKECYYIVNQFIRMQYEDNHAIQGNIYDYGFYGWDGENLRTCSLLREKPLDKYNHFTAWSNTPIGKQLEVCSIVVRVLNVSPDSPQSLIFITMSSLRLLAGSLFVTALFIIYSL